MPSVIPIVALLVRSVAIVVGLSITATSYRAYARTEDPAFWYSTVGFAVLSFGVVIESVLLRTVPLNITEIHTAESLVFAIGFTILYLSLNGRPNG